MAYSVNLRLPPTSQPMSIVSAENHDLPKPKPEAATPVVRLLRHRLQTDIKELFELPLPLGLKVVTSDDDPSHICVHITPPRGHFRDRPLHFDLEMPLDWPQYPPVITGGHWLKITPQLLPVFWVCRRNVDSSYLLQPRHYSSSHTLYQVILTVGAPFLPIPQSDAYQIWDFRSTNILAVQR
jgi:hypothetical protein